MATTNELRDRAESYLPLVNGLRGTLEDSKYSDLTIVCGERRWRVHKVVLCPQVKFFAKACEGVWQEARANTVLLPDDPPAAVAAMLRYLYTVDYDDESQGEESTSPIVFNLHVHTIADKYDIPGLAKLATSRFGQRAAEQWQTAGFAEAASLVNTNAELRDFRRIIVAVATKHAKDLNHENYGVFFRRVVKRIPEFGGALWAKLAEEVGDEPRETWHMCPNHGCDTRTSESQLVGEGWYTCAGCRRSYLAGQFRNP